MGDVIRFSGADAETIKRLEAFVAAVKAGKFTDFVVFADSEVEDRAHAIIAHKDPRRLIGTLEILKSFAIRRAFPEVDWESDDPHR